MEIQLIFKKCVIADTGANIKKTENVQGRI